MIYTKRLGPSASRQAGRCTNALTSPRKILMPQSALTVQCMMHLAMAFMSFINWLCYKALDNEVRNKCYLEGWWPCQCQCLCKCWCYLKKSWWHKMHQVSDVQFIWQCTPFIDLYMDLHNVVMAQCFSASRWPCQMPMPMSSIKFLMLQDAPSIWCMI